MVKLTVNTNKIKWWKLIAVFVIAIIGMGIYLNTIKKSKEAKEQEEFEDYLRNMMIWELHSRRCAVTSNGEYYESQIMGVIYSNTTLNWWVRCYNSRNASNYMDMQLKTDVSEIERRMANIRNQLNQTALPPIG